MIDDPKGFDLCGLLSIDISILEIEIERCFKHKNIHTCDSTAARKMMSLLVS